MERRFDVLADYAVMLAQFLMAPVAGALRQAVTHPVLTSPASAVARLKDRRKGADSSDGH